MREEEGGGLKRQGGEGGGHALGGGGRGGVGLSHECLNYGYYAKFFQSVRRIGVVLVRYCST